jgi:hypothetical protein
MGDDSVLAKVLGDLVGLPDGVLEHVLDAIDAAAVELSDLDHDDLVTIVSAAVTGMAGAATKHHLERNRRAVESAVRKALAAGL